MSKSRQRKKYFDDDYDYEENKKQKIKYADQRKEKKWKKSFKDIDWQRQQDDE